MLEHFVLSNLLLAVCCWSSSYFPLLLWVLWLMDHFLHDQCCSSHDDWTLLSNLDTNLQTGWSLCSVPLWINLLFPPTLLFYSCAVYPFACFQSHQCWVSGFSSILGSRYRERRFRVSLTMVTAQISAGYLAKIKDIHTRLLVVP